MFRSRTLVSSDVNDFDSLREMIVLEQFKNSLLVRVPTYVSEQKAKTAAAVTDDSVLMHRWEFWKAQGWKCWQGKPSPNVCVFFNVCKSLHSRPSKLKQNGHQGQRCYIPSPC